MPQEVLDYIKVNGTISDEEIQSLLDIKKTRSFTLTRQMIEEGLLVMSGRGKNKLFSLSKDNGN